MQGGPSSVRFGCGSCTGWFERFQFSVPTVPLWKVFFFLLQYCFNRKGRLRFRLRLLKNSSDSFGSSFGSGKIRDKFPHRGFCASGTRIYGRIPGKRILDARILDPNSGVEFFGSIFSSKKRPPEKFTQEIHLPKFTSKNSTQKSGQKIHIAPLQGHLAEEKRFRWFRRFRSTVPVRFLGHPAHVPV